MQKTESEEKCNKFKKAVKISFHYPLSQMLTSSLNFAFERPLIMSRAEIIIVFVVVVLYITLARLIQIWSFFTF